MLPVIIQCFDSSLVNLECEDELITRWQESPPKVGETISMGGESRWTILEVHIFQSFTPLHSVEAVYLANVHIDGQPLPSKEQWTYNIFKDDYPNESIYIRLVNDAIEIGFHMDGLTPTVGTQLEGYEQIGDTTSFKSVPRPWVISEVESYLPVGNAPYSKVDVCLCRELALVA